MWQILTIDISAKVPSKIMELLSRHQLIYSIAGLVLGGIAVIGGIILFFFGITGSTTWVATILGAKSELNDAAPGALFVVIGLLIVFVTRFNIRVRNNQHENNEPQKSGVGCNGDQSESFPSD